MYRGDAVDGRPWAAWPLTEPSDVNGWFMRVVAVMDAAGPPGERVYGRVRGVLPDGLRAPDGSTGPTGESACVCFNPSARTWRCVGTPDPDEDAFRTRPATTRAERSVRLSCVAPYTPDEWLCLAADKQWRPLSSEGRLVLWLGGARELNPTNEWTASKLHLPDVAVYVVHHVDDPATELKCDDDARVEVWREDVRIATVQLEDRACEGVEDEESTDDDDEEGTFAALLRHIGIGTQQGRTLTGSRRDA